jgi:phage replication O-like protein O
MASPQIENGYTKVANELLEALARINLDPYENRVLLFIIRKTYGWHKKMDWISLSQIAMGTGIRKSHISRTINSLEERNLVIRGSNKHIGLQKDYERWKKKLPKEATRVT